MKLVLRDENSTYLGDGAYGHIDPHGRLWVVTFDGISITNQVCIEDSAIESLMYLRNKVNNVPVSNSNVAKHYAEPGDIYGWDCVGHIGWITPEAEEEHETESTLDKKEEP